MRKEGQGCREVTQRGHTREAPRSCAGGGRPWQSRRGRRPGGRRCATGGGNRVVPCRCVAFPLRATGECIGRFPQAHPGVASKAGRPTGPEVRDRLHLTPTRPAPLSRQHVRRGLPLGAMALELPVSHPPTRSRGSARDQVPHRPTFQGRGAPWSLGSAADRCRSVNDAR